MHTHSSNFFLILDLDPQAPWDPEIFAQRLRAKQNQWSRESTGFTKKAQIAKRNLEQLGEIKRVMENPQERELQASAALAECAEQSQARKETFAHRLHLAEEKGFLEPAEVTGLTDEFKDVYSARQIQAQITVDVRACDPPSSDEQDPHLELQRLQELNDHLAVVGKKDLYDLLHLPATAATSDLHAAADRLYGEMLHRQPKNALVSSTTILSGYARLLFQSEHARHGYDQSLSTQALGLLLQDLEDALKHTSKKLVYARQIEDFVSRARQIGWEAPAALQQLQGYARQHGWQLQSGRAPEESEQSTISIAPVSREPAPAPPAPVVQTSSGPLPAPEPNDAPLPEVRDLRSQNTHTGLRLTWLWPQEANEAHLVYSFTNWPQPGGEHQHTLVIARGEYEARGHYLLPAGIRASYFLVVSLVAQRNGQPVLTPGTRLYVPLAEKRELTYKIKNPRPGYKQRTLHILLSEPGRLPALLLVIKQGGLPFHKSEGQILHREQEMVMAFREHVIPLPATRFPTQTFGKVFLEDDDLYTVVVIHHPHEKHLRLG